MGHIPETVMRGATTIREILQAFLPDATQEIIDVARDQWPIADNLLPYFESFDVYDPSLITNDQFPGVGIFPASSRNFIRDDYLPSGAQKYESTYSMQILVAARTPRNETDTGWVADPKKAAIVLRDDLTGLLQSVLLQTPSLNSGGRCSMDENSMSVTYMDPMTATSQGQGRWIAASIISADFRLTEVTYAQPYGIVETVVVEVEKWET